MFDATLAALQRAIDLRMRRQEIISSNIANANVPEFKARKLDFEQRLQTALESVEEGREPLRLREARTHQALKTAQPDIYEDPTARMNGSGNTVDMDKEQTELGKNTLGFEASIELLNRKFNMHKLVLGDGGR